MDRRERRWPSRRGEVAILPVALVTMAKREPSRDQVVTERMRDSCTTEATRVPSVS